MNEIKFRGLRKDGNGWVYGYLVEHHNITGIIPIDEIQCMGDGWVLDFFYVDVIPETVGMMVKFGEKEFYQGDKIQYLEPYFKQGNTADWFGEEPQNSQPVYEEHLEERIGVIEFKDGCFSVNGFALRYIINHLGDNVTSRYYSDEGNDLKGFVDSLEVDKLDRLDWNNYETINDHLDVLEEELNKMQFEFVKVIGNIHET